MSRVLRHGSKDPPQRQWKFGNKIKYKKYLSPIILFTKIKRDKLGLSCAKLRLNWASMLRLQQQKIALFIYIYPKLFSAEISRSHLGSMGLQSKFSLFIVINNWLLLRSSSLEVIFHLSKKLIIKLKIVLSLT